MAISKNLTGRYLASVLSTAIRDGELTGDQCMKLCGIAKEKLTGGDLASVLSKAIESGKLTDSQRGKLEAMARGHSEAMARDDLSSASIFL